MSENWENIRKAAENLGTSLDAEKAWERFDANRVDNRKIIIPWWKKGKFLLFLLFGLVSLTLWRIMDKQSDLETANTTELSKSEAIKKNENKANGNLSIDNKLIETQENITELPKRVKSQNPKPEIENLNSNTVRISDRVSQKESIDRKEPISQKQKSNQKNLDSKTKKKTSTQRQNKRTENATSKKPQKNLAIKKNSFPQTKNKTKSGNELQSNKLFGALMQWSKENEPENGLAIEDLDELKSRSLNVLFFEERTLPYCWLNITKLGEQLPIQSKTKRRSGVWSISLDYFYGLADRQVDWVDDPLNLRRLNGETMKENNALSFLITRKLGRRFSLSTGLLLNQYRSTLFEVDQVIINKAFEDEVVATLTRAGSTTPVTGTVYGTRTNITERRRQQKYQLLSIPVNLNYILPLSKSLSLQLSGGLSYSIGGQTKGVSYASAFSQGEYEDLSSFQYKNAGLVQGMAGLQVNKQLRQDLQLTLGCRYYQDLASRREQTFKSEKFSSFGLSVGLSKVL